jgi:acyl dehydratase
MGRLFDAFSVGQRFETPARVITEEDIFAFAKLSGDYNPVHTDDGFAKATGFPRRIAHGPMGIGLAFGLAANLDLIDGTAVALLSVAWDFLAPMKPGDAIKALIDVTEKRHVRDPARGLLGLSFTIVDSCGMSMQTGSARLLMRRTTYSAAEVE